MIDKVVNRVLRYINIPFSCYVSLCKTVGYKKCFNKSLKDMITIYVFFQCIL